MRRRSPVWSVGLLTAVLSASAYSATDPLAPQLRAQVEKARTQLGNLQPWQEEAFLAEVLPSSGRFIKDYSSKGGVLTRAEIDLDGIKRYLAFHSEQVLKTNRKALLAVRATEKCAPCVGAVPDVRKDLKERLERRGFEVVVLSAADSGKDLSEVLAQKSASGWVLASVRNVEDPEHPGEFRNELLMEFRFPGTLLSRVQKQMEILPNASIEVSMSRMAVDGFTELGNLVRQARIGSMEAEGNEGVEVNVTGMTNFSQLQELKKALQTQFENSARVTEKRLERGRVALAVVGEVKTGDVVRALQAVQHSHLKLKVVATRDGAVEVAATPIKGAS